MSRILQESNLSSELVVSGTIFGVKSLGPIHDLRRWGQGMYQRYADVGLGVPGRRTTEREGLFELTRSA